MTSESSKEWKYPKKDSDYVVPGQLQGIVTDGLINKRIMTTARDCGLNVFGYTAKRPSKYMQTEYNLLQLFNLYYNNPEDHAHNTIMFNRVSEKNMEECDTTLILNCSQENIIFNFIGHCLTGTAIPLTDDYSTEHFYYWTEKRIFVVNCLSKDARRNLRNFIILNGVKKLCIVATSAKPGDSSTLGTFFRKAFRIRATKAPQL